MSKRKHRWSREFKEAAVARMESAETVCGLALELGVCRELLFKWRRLYLDGAYGQPTLGAHAVLKPDCEAPALLPVSIVAELSAPAVTISADAPLLENVCEVEFARACLRIRGDVSPATLRLLIRELSR